LKNEKEWTKEEDQILLEGRSWDPPATWGALGLRLGREPEACRSHFRFVLSKAIDTTVEGESFEQGDDFINIIYASRSVPTKEEIISKFKIDMTIWEIDRFKIKTSEGYRKDRKVEWSVRDGKVLRGEVADSGKMLIVPLYHTEIHFTKHKEVAKAKLAIADMIEDAKKYAPVYKALNYPDRPDGFLGEIDIFDIHFGRLTWEEESGGNYDIKIAKKIVLDTLERLLQQLAFYPLSKILLPIGNDFFNCDNKDNTTTRGTPQQEDTRWQKTFKAGRETLVEMIDLCQNVAPVDVLVIPGNHDQQRSYYLGDSLYSWYHACPNVTIDNRATQRKYYQYWDNLIGFTHGSEERLEKLPFLMAEEQPKLWATTKHREWHTGDKHHIKDFDLKTDEGIGMTIRILSSLAQHDAWTFNSGYKSKRAAQAFLWSQHEGLSAQFTALPPNIK